MGEPIRVDFEQSTRKNIVLKNGRKEEKLTKDGKLKRTPNNSKENRDYILPYKENDVGRMVEWLDSKIMCSQNDEQEFINRRNKAIYLMGCNCGLRVSDLCSLKWSDVFDSNGKLRSSKVITPKKTSYKGKHIEIEFTDAFKIALVEYIKGAKIAVNHDYVKEVVKLQKKYDMFVRNLVTMENNRTGKYPEEEKKLCRTNKDMIATEIGKYTQYLWVFPSREGGHIESAAIDYFIKQGKRALGIDYPVATHSLRKTYARIKYDHEENKSQAAKYLQTIFGHSSESVTMIYIGIRQEEIHDFCNQTPIGVDVEKNKSILGEYV